jgi:hypothetical protein
MKMMYFLVGEATTTAIAVTSSYDALLMSVPVNIDHPQRKKRR